MVWCVHFAVAALVVGSDAHGASALVAPEKALLSSTSVVRQDKGRSPAPERVLQSVKAGTETEAAIVKTLRGTDPVGPKIIATYVIARHGTKVPAAFEFSPLLGSDQKKLLAGHPEILETGDKQVAALTARFGAAPGKLLPSATNCEEAIAQLLVSDDMSSKIYTYSSNNERDIATAHAFLDGAGFSDGPISVSQPFLIGEGGILTEGCPRATQAETETSVEQQQGAAPTDLVTKKVEPQLKRLSQIMGVDLLSMPLEWIGPAGQPGPLYQTYSGGLLVGCRMSEYAVIEATSGAPDPVYLKLGMTVDELSWLLETCDLLYSFYKNPVNLNRFGGELPVHLLAALAQTATGVRSGLPSVEHGIGTRAVLYAGHDVNVDFMRQILMLEWGNSSGPLRPDADPFHIKFVLQLVQQGDDVAVRSFVVAPSLPARTRNCTALTDADVYAISPCGDGQMTCPWPTFRDQLTQGLRTSLARPPPHEHAPCLQAPTAEWWGNESDGPAADVVRPVAILLASLFVAFLIYVLVSRRRAPPDGMEPLVVRRN